MALQKGTMSKLFEEKLEVTLTYLLTAIFHKNSFCYVLKTSNLKCSVHKFFSNLVDKLILIQGNVTSETTVHNLFSFFYNMVSWTGDGICINISLV